jgi:hypothetical protein
MSQESQEKVKTLGVAREDGHSYYLEKGDVWRKSVATGEAELVAALGLAQEKGYVYFLDPDGDVSRKPEKKSVEEAPPERRVTFEEAFAALRSHIGKAAKLDVAARTGGLSAGSHEITVFDWQALSADDKAFFVESQLLELAAGSGKGWDAHLVPWAVVDGESHPVPLDELDQQTNGVLLLDLRRGGAVMYCTDSSSRSAKLLAGDAGTLKITIE